MKGMSCQSPLFKRLTQNYLGESTSLDSLFIIDQKSKMQWNYF